MAATVVFTLALFEGGAYLALRALSESPVAGALLYQQPEVTTTEYTAYLAARDPVLGWPPPAQLGTDKYDRSGARPTPAFPQAADACVSLYGDSFTYASDVDHHHAWGNVLSMLLDCRVANYGVGGYGTDQAVLRFKHKNSDRAPTTLLGIFPTNVMRNLTRNAYFVFGNYPTAFKPRFAIDNGQLSLLPMPSITPRDLSAYLKCPGCFLDQDPLLPGSAYGPGLLRFPYAITLLRVATHQRVLNWLRGRPSWISYLEPGHPISGLEVLTGIIGRFDALCREQDRRCFVMLIPTPKSYDYYMSDQVNAMQTVIDELQQRGIGFLDLLPGFAAYLGSRPYCDLIGTTGLCAGHWNEEGNRIVAELVQHFLVAAVP